MENNTDYPIPNPAPADLGHSQDRILRGPLGSFNNDHLQYLLDPEVGALDRLDFLIQVRLD